jgi:hypothetical protein
MPSSYSSNLRLELIASGEQANTWGNTTNTNLGTLLESSIAGRVELSSGWVANSLTLTALNGANDQSRQMCLVVPAITISADSNIVVPASAVTASSGKLYTVINRSTSYAVTIKLPATTGVTIPANTTKTVIYNGTDFQEAFTALNFLTLTGTPTVNAHAVNKGYVDGKFFINAGANTVTGNTTFSGTVTLPVTTPTGNQATSYNYVNSNYLWKAAGESTQTMIPRLKLTQAAVDNDDVITKGYADSNFVGLTTVQTISGTKTFSTNVSLSGSAQLILPNAPLSGTQATNKSYVDGEIAAASSQAASTFVPQTRTITVGTGLQVNGTASADLSGNINLQLVGGGTVTSVTATSPLTATGTTAVNLSMNIASTSQNGYLTSTDWNTFNGKCNANGSNASGTWAISIAGNAGTASSASAVPWTGVSGRPTALSQFSNDVGFITSSGTVSTALIANALSGGTVGYTASDFVLKTGSQTLTTSNPTTTVPGFFRVANSASSFSAESGIYYSNSTATYLAYIGSQAASGTGSNRPPLIFLQRYGSTTSPFMSSTTAGELLVNSLGSTNGTVYVNNGVLTTTNPSDARLKTNVTDLSFGLKEIISLRPVSFTWDTPTADQSKKSYGFIAQEVQDVIPELVSEYEHKNDPYAEDSVVRFGLDKEGIYAGLVAAVQELNAKVEALQTEVEALKGA